MTNLAIAANGLRRKSYGDKTVLDGVDLAVPERTIFSLLGRPAPARPAPSRSLHPSSPRRRVRPDPRRLTRQPHSRPVHRHRQVGGRHPPITAVRPDAHTPTGRVRNDPQAPGTPEQSDRTVKVRAGSNGGDILVRRA